MREIFHRLPPEVEWSLSGNLSASRRNLDITGNMGVTRDTFATSNNNNKIENVGGEKVVNR